MLETLDAAAVRRWCGNGLEALRAHQHEIDELNVYPVPDGDTGTNLVLTLASAQEALEQLLIEESDAPAPGVGHGRSGSPEEPADRTTPLGRAMRRMARGALLGARGNSGVIVSQILRGMADTFATSVAVRGSELARALRTATEAAYGAVARPVEGTVLSVVAAAADGAARVRSDDLIAVARAAALAATEALARTPRQLPALARAGVVDAGGRGLCLLLDALVDAVAPAAEISPVAETSPSSSGASTVSTGPGLRSGEIHHHGVSDTPGGPGYEVQYLIDAEVPAVQELRRSLDSLGDSLVVVGTGEGAPPTWNVHVHVPATGIGPALEAGLAAGRPHRITVTPLIETAAHLPGAQAVQPDRDGGEDPSRVVRHGAVQTDRRQGTGRRADDRPAEPTEDRSRGTVRPAAGRLDGTDPRTEGTDPPSDGARGAVVGAAGGGLTALFEAEGTIVVDRSPSIGELLEAIVATGCRFVVLLPNDRNTHAVATSAAREAEQAGIRVSVVPTRSPVQALAALAVRDPARSFTDDVIAMAEAAGACRYGEVCTAQRAALTVAGPCNAGDLLGLVDGEVHVIGTDLAEVSRRLLDRMLGGGGELATLLLGADAPAGLAETLGGHLAQAWPFVEVQCYAGGQPRYHLLVGVE